MSSVIIIIMITDDYSYDYHYCNDKPTYYYLTIIIITNIIYLTLYNINVFYVLINCPKYKPIKNNTIIPTVKLFT